jgi:hypothetical protein
MSTARGVAKGLSAHLAASVLSGSRLSHRKHSKSVLPETVGTAIIRFLQCGHRVTSRNSCVTKRRINLLWEQKFLRFRCAGVCNGQCTHQKQLLRYWESLLMAKDYVRRGMPPVKLSREEFDERYRTRFIDPLCEPLQKELDAIIEAAWDAYSNSETPLTAKPGPAMPIPITILPLTGSRRAMRSSRRSAITMIRSRNPAF